MTKALIILIAGILSMNAADTTRPAAGTTNATAVATFGGGCFWCTEAVFENVKGVKSAVSGYAGGTKENPTYREVCNETTGHAEVIQVAFDPAQVSYDTILQIFFETHDPTTPNRQGADQGTQYRSIILYHDETQKKAAEEAKKRAAKEYKDPITTEVVPLKKFYAAEGYHQDFYAKNPNVPYCAVVIRPKLQKFLKKQNKT